MHSPATALLVAALPRSLLVAALLLLPGCVAADNKRCAACALVMQRLSDVRDEAQLALEPARQARDRAAKASEKVQTKRWLKGEHGVALHSAVEDALEGVCSRMELRVTGKSCQHLLEDHDESLVEATMRGASVEAACAAAVGKKCTESVVAEALASRSQLRSEPLPAAGADAVGPRGEIRKLVALSYDDAVAEKDMYVVVMLHHSDPDPAANGSLTTPEFAPAGAEYYKLIDVANGTVPGTR